MSVFKKERKKKQFKMTITYISKYNQHNGHAQKDFSLLSSRKLIQIKHRLRAFELYSKC